MADEGTQELSAKDLRTRMEEAIAARSALEKELHGYKVRDLIESKGLKWVEAEDLEQVDPSELEQKAEQLETERLQERETVLREFLPTIGLEGEALENAIRGDSGAMAEGYQRAREVQQVGGQPAPVVNPDKLHGRDAIAAGLKG